MNPSDFEASLKFVAVQLGDPVREVYARLFARQPELEALFVLDTDGAVRGEMLARVLESLDSLVADAGYAEQLLQAEYINHCAMGIPNGGFTLFLDVLIETFSTELGESWLPEFEAVWRQLQTRVSTIEKSTD